MLEVTSTDIVFDMKNDQYIPFTLGLKNTTNQYLAFKIKSTKPEYFSVKQSRGIINPQQKENVEFSTTDRTKNLDPKYLVNQKFQIYVIGMNERKSTAEIDKLFQSEACQNIRLCTCVYREDQGKKIPIHNESLATSNTSFISKSRIEQQSQMYSIIKSQTSTNQVEYVSKLRTIEEQIANEKRKREQLFNTKEIAKLKKGFSIINNRFLFNEICCANNFGNDIIQYLLSSSCYFEMKNQQSNIYFYFQCLLIQSISHYFQQCINLNHFRCGITIVRDRELAENELEYYKQMNYGLWVILIPFIFLLLPIFPKQQQQHQLPEEDDNYSPIQEMQNQNASDISNNHKQKTENQEQLNKSDKKEENSLQNSQINSNRISIINQADQVDSQAIQLNFNSSVNKILANLNTSENELNENIISDISHQNQRSFTEETERESSNLIQNSKIIHSYSNSYQIKDQSLSDEGSFSLIRILEIIDEVPLLVMRKYEEFIRVNREQRRKFIFKDFDQFTDDDAQQYIQLLKNLFRFHDNLIRKGQKYYIYKNKLDYSKFMKCFKQYLMDPLSSNEILSHQRFALKQIRYSLQNNHTLLNYQVLEIYEILIQLMSNPNQIILIISKQFQHQQEQLYLSSILQYYLEDYIYYQKGIEDEDFQRYLNIYHNQNEIINMQYTLDEKTSQFLYKLQRN